jgi:hypothetical protein
MCVFCIYKYIFCVNFIFAIKAGNSYILEHQYL